MLDQQSLGEGQVLRNSILHFLCLLTGYDRQSAPGEVTPSTFDVMATKSKVEDVLSVDHFDPSLSADIQMVSIFLYVCVCARAYMHICVHACVLPQKAKSKM